MGGVDLFDELRGLYRIRIRSKKWYWPFVRFCINGALVNMWLLYRNVHPKVSLLHFTRKIVLSILTAPEHLMGPKPKCSRNILSEIRFDKIDHLVSANVTQRQCAYCKKCVKFICSKCNVGLHPKECFQLYHTPSKWNCQCEGTELLVMISCFIFLYFCTFHILSFLIFKLRCLWYEISYVKIESVIQYSFLFHWSSFIF